MANFIEVAPSYGRDYKSAKEAKEAWNEGKDFTIQDVTHPNYGAQINKFDAEKIPGGVSINIRYKKMTGVTVVKVKSK